MCQKIPRVFLSRSSLENSHEELENYYAIFNGLKKTMYETIAKSNQQKKQQTLCHKNIPDHVTLVVPVILGHL